MVSTFAQRVSLTEDVKWHVYLTPAGREGAYFYSLSAYQDRTQQLILTVSLGSQLLLGGRHGEKAIRYGPGGRYWQTAPI